MAKLPYGFNTVFGRNLLAELANFVHRPFVVATMEDLWPLFEKKFDGAQCIPYFAKSMEIADLEKALADLPDFQAVVGLGGGQALDTAKYLSWRNGGLPLFQVPTALSTNAAFGQRCGVRDNGQVLYRGWSVPEAVYIDFGILQSAPRQLNYSGICDVLCLHTGVLDWRYADRIGKCEEKWPYDVNLAAQSLAHVDKLIAGQDEIRNLTEKGIRLLVDGLSWGTSYHGAGWCPRHIEGIDHFLFYALEAATGIKFLHGQPVCLGIYVGCLLHDSRAQEILDVISHIGLDIRPAAMGLTWDDVEAALLGLSKFVRDAGLWYTIAHDARFDRDFLDQLRNNVEGAYRD